MSAPSFQEGVTALLHVIRQLQIGFVLLLLSQLLFCKRVFEHKNELIESKNENVNGLNFITKNFTENSIKLFDDLNHPLWCVSVSS